MAVALNGGVQPIFADTDFDVNVANGTFVLMFKGSFAVDRCLFGANAGALMDVADFESFYIATTGTTNEVRISISDGATRIRKFTSATLFDNAWHQLIIVFTGRDISAVYVDAVAQTLGAASPAGSISTDHVVIQTGVAGFPKVGGMSRPASPLSGLAGTYAEVALYDTAFTLTDVADLYNAGTYLTANAVQATSLKHYWTFQFDGKSNVWYPPYLDLEYDIVGNSFTDHPIVPTYTEEDIAWAILWPDGTYMVKDVYPGTVLRWAQSDYDTAVVSSNPASQTVNRNVVLNLAVVSTLTPTQTVTRGVFTFGRTVRSALTVAQTIARNLILNRTLSHQLVVKQPFTQGGVLPPQSVLSELTVDQIIEVETELIEREYVSHVLTVTQIIGVQAVRTRSVVHTVGIVSGNPRPGSGAIGTVLEGSITFEHEPVGANMADRPSVLYDLDQNETVTFEYPYDSPTHTLTIRAPLFGNREEIEAQRVQRYTLKNDIITYRDPDWFSVRVFRTKFDTLTEAEVADFMEFVRVSLGQPVKYTDHEGRVWCVLIRNPNGNISTKRDTCDKAVEVDMETINDDDL